MQNFVAGERVVSYLTASDDPRGGGPFELVFRWSDTGKFWQVAPWVIENAAASGMSSRPQQGMLLLGHGAIDSDRDGVHLAWLPLPLLPMSPDMSVRYFDGSPDLDTWPTDLAAAVPLWETLPGYTSVSLAWLEGPARWIAPYSQALVDPA